MDRVADNQQFIMRLLVALYALDQKSLTIPWLTSMTSKIPLYSIGLGWLIPAAIGIVLGILLSLTFKKKAAPANE